MLLQIGTTAEKGKTMNKKGNLSKAVFMLALFSVVMMPLGILVGGKASSISEGVPFTVLGWWHRSGPYALASGVIDAVILSIVAWRMQKSGM